MTAVPADHRPTAFSAWPWLEPPGAAGVPAAAPEPPPPPGGRWPTISVVTPNYNYGHLLDRTMRSVLNQGYPALEYIVVDDGSTDDSVDVIRRHEGRLAYWTTRPNRGQYASVNEGMARATGDVCCWLDSDDVQLPWTLRCVGAIFARFPEVQWVVGHPAVLYDGVVHHVRPRLVYPRELIRAGLFYGHGAGGLGWIAQENLFWRRGLWEGVGGLREELSLGADYELNVRFAEHAELYATSTLLGGFGVRPGQNRSTRGKVQYEADTRVVLAELRAKGVRVPGVDLYQRVRKSRVARAVVSRAFGLRRLRGPLLQWDFDSAEYRVQRERFF